MYRMRNLLRLQMNVGLLIITNVLPSLAGARRALASPTTRVAVNSPAAETPENHFS